MIVLFFCVRSTKKKKKKKRKSKKKTNKTDTKFHVTVVDLSAQDNERLIGTNINQKDGINI